MTSTPLENLRSGLASRLWPGLVLVAGLLSAPGLPAANPDAPRHLTADAVYDPQALRALAERGDKRAAFLLGSRFASGRSGVRDDSEAVRWFQQAAEGGLAEAQYNLGIMHASGRGVPRDYAQAAAWYERAAQQGLAEAQFNLGTLYGLGRGVARDEALAASWLRRAADKGLAVAQYNLGALYEHGRGVRLDGYQALEWYRQAAEQGFEPARIRHAALKQKLVAAPAAPGTDSASSAPPSTGPGARGTPPVDGRAAVAWVSGLDPDHYTMQLASFSTLDDALRFMNTLDGDAGRGVYPAVKGGQRRFGVVYGSWPTYESARGAVAALPASLANLKPWVRKAALIQREMTR